MSEHSQYLSFDNGIRRKVCSRMLYGIACGTRGWVYISSHGLGYDIPSLSARYCVAFGRSASMFSAKLQDAMADDESESREGAAMTQDQFALLMGTFSALQAQMEKRFAEFRAEIQLGQEDAAAKALKRARYEKPYEYKRRSNQY